MCVRCEFVQMTTLMWAVEGELLLLICFIRMLRNFLDVEDNK